jgi:predicted transposase/invertase (TIGR01784 family)
MYTKFINPFTDFGFKKLFGEEASKPMLIDFLSCLLPEAQIVDLSFKDKEQLGKTAEDRKAIFDIYCENTKGERIIVELQKAKQKYFKDRSVYYSTFPIQEQAKKNNWAYELNAVYCIGILDFIFDEDTNSNKQVVQVVQLKDQENQVFYDKLQFVFVEMPRFTKTESELETRLDKWLYFIKNLENFEVIPTLFKDEVFLQAFDAAAIANYDAAERDYYDKSLKIYRDLKGVVDTSYEQGVEQGIEQGNLLRLHLTIDRCIENGLSIKDTAIINAISEEEVKAYLQLKK